MNDKAKDVFRRLQAARGLVPVYRSSATGAFDYSEEECSDVSYLMELADALVGECERGVFEARDMLKSIGLTYELIKASAEAAKRVSKTIETQRPRRKAITRITNAFEPIIKVIATQRRLPDSDVDLVGRWLSLFVPEHKEFSFTDEELMAAIGLTLRHIAYLNGALIVACDDRKKREAREEEEKKRLKKEDARKKQSVINYDDIGHAIADSWGLVGADIGTVITAATAEKHSVSVQCAMLNTLKRIATTIELLPSTLAKASRAADLEIARVQRDVEKYRAQQIEAQARIAEASRPVKVTMCQMTPDEIADEYDGGRVLFRF